MTETDTPLTTGDIDTSRPAKKKAAKKPAKKAAPAKKAPAKKAAVKKVPAKKAASAATKKAPQPAKKKSSKASSSATVTPARSATASAAKVTKKAPKTPAPLVPLEDLKPRADFGLSRIDQVAGKTKGGKPRGEQHGYYVRVNHPENGTLSKWFGDNAHGGQSKAEKAAKAFRDNLFVQLPERQRRAAAKQRNG